jgi:hypothetical protein
MGVLDVLFSSHMDELPFKIVRMQGSQDELIARVEKFADLQSGVQKARMLTWRCAKGRESFVVETGTARDEGAGEGDKSPNA